MAQRTEQRPTDGLSVVVIDEDKCHANSAQSMLSKLNFYVTLCTSPIKALSFLENHEQEVDFVLAAVHMEELNGFQFLEVAREVHKNLQVIMMSTETSIHTMKRSVELGARFLVKKPLDADTIHSVWQHLDPKVSRINKIKYLFQGVADKIHVGQEIGKCTTVQKKDGTEKTKACLMWTPYLQRTFVHALELLGENASPKKIAMIMNVDAVESKHISSHLQKHQKGMERELRRPLAPKRSYSWKSASNSKSTKSRTNIQGFPGDTQDGDAYVAIRRALQFGTVFDESKYSTDNEPDGSVDEANGSNSSGDAQAVAAETNNADDAQGSIPDDQVPSGSEVAAVGLVDYSDSEEDDEVDTSPSNNR